MKGEQSDGYLRNPSFETLDELKDILETSFELYTELVKEIASSIHNY